jgi:hypothetical protein
MSKQEKQILIETMIILWILEWELWSQKKEGVQ